MLAIYLFSKKVGRFYVHSADMYTQLALNYGGKSIRVEYSDILTSGALRVVEKSTFTESTSRFGKRIGRAVTELGGEYILVDACSAPGIENYRLNEHEYDEGFVASSSIQGDNIFYDGCLPENFVPRCFSTPHVFVALIKHFCNLKFGRERWLVAFIDMDWSSGMRSAVDLFLDHRSLQTRFQCRFLREIGGIKFFGIQTENGITGRIGFGIYEE